MPRDDCRLQQAAEDSVGCLARNACRFGQLFPLDAFLAHRPQLVEDSLARLLELELLANDEGYRKLIGKGGVLQEWHQRWATEALRAA